MLYIVHMDTFKTSAVILCAHNRICMHTMRFALAIIMPGHCDHNCLVKFVCHVQALNIQSCTKSALGVIIIDLSTNCDQNFWYLSLEFSYDTH